MTQQLSHVYPIGSHLDERGRLRVGGCDVIEVAREFGTPAYIVAEDDLRHRARAFKTAFERAARPDVARVRDEGVRRARRCCGVFAEEGLGCDVASGGELALALRAGIDPARIHLHGNAKSEGELREALDAGIGDVVVDNVDDIEKLERVVAARPGPRPSSCASRPTSPATPTPRSPPARPTRSSASASTTPARRSRACAARTSSS